MLRATRVSYVEEIWTVGGILLPYILSVPSYSWAWNEDLRLSMTGAIDNTGADR
jgi:hypothetical protein